MVEEPYLCVCGGGGTLLACTSSSLPLRRYRYARTHFRGQQNWDVRKRIPFFSSGLEPIGRPKYIYIHVCLC